MSVCANTNFYRARDHEASPFFKLVRERFAEFEAVYPQRYQQKYGYWRPVIRRSMDKFLKCGDLKEGFARVRCPDCGEEFFVAFSCRQRSCCPTCDQKRALLLGYRLREEVLAPVPHRHWVFTIPKRLRIYFRYDRSMLGKLCRAAYETVAEVFRLELDGDAGVPAMVGAVQTFGDLVHWHPHVHAIVADGVFTDSGYFVHISDIWKHRAYEIWEDKVFDLLQDECCIDDSVVTSMKSWRHSGFSIDNSVRLEADDGEGMQRLVEYIARCPFSLARMVFSDPDGNIVYRSNKGNCIPFPITADDGSMKKGIPRNFHVYEPLEFLAEVTQHIPNKGEHQIRYYGWYSNKKRGMRQAGKSPESSDTSPRIMDEYWHKLEPDNAQRRNFRLCWAALIKLVYEVDPLKCPKCGGTMKIISFITEEPIVEHILRHCRKWKEIPPRAPPKVPELPVFGEPTVDYGFFENICN